MKNIILRLEREFWSRRLFNIESTLSTSLVRIWTSGLVHEARAAKGNDSSDSESIELLEGISAKILVFSTDCMKDWPSLVKCGMDDVTAFLSFFYERPGVLAVFAIIKNFAPQLFFV